MALHPSHTRSTTMKRKDGELRRGITLIHNEEDDPRNITIVFPISDEETAHMHEMNSHGSLYQRWSKISEEKRHRWYLGLYKNFNDVDDKADASSFLARKLACKISAHMVALSCKNPIFSGEVQQNSSGIVVQYKGTKTILTSPSIFGGHSDAKNLKVEVLFPNGNKVDGKASFIDEHHNVALIHAELDSIGGVSLATDLVPLGVDVMSLGRESRSGLMASRGKIDIRKDILDSNDLMSSSCTISESGIGGPLIDISSGNIIGMNVFMRNKAALFMPNVILNHCLQQLLDYGKVMRPWLGLKTRSISEKKLKDLELIYQKFPSTNGIIVNEVIKGSPADQAGLCTGDVIISCNDILLSSPVQLADLLLSLGKSHSRELTSEVKRRVKTIEIIIQRSATGTTESKSIILNDFTPRVINSWPVLPIEIRHDVDLSTYD